MQSQYHHQQGGQASNDHCYASAACSEPVCQCNKRVMPGQASVQDQVGCMHLMLPRCGGGWQSIMS